MSEPTARSTEQRRFEGRVNLSVGVALLLAIVVMVNYLSFRHYSRWDWTSQGVFTLSDRGRAVLGELDRDIDIYLLLSRGEPNFADLSGLLERIRAASQRVQLHFVEPDRDRAEFIALAQRFDIGALGSEEGSLQADVAMIVASRDRHWKVDRSDLIQFSYDEVADEGERTVDVRSEQAVIGAILEVVQGRPTKVCVTAGHGEWTVNEAAQRDLAPLEDQMRRDNVEVESWQTRGASRVPEDCDAVFVVGPTSAFTREEADLLRDYARGGGNLLVAADPSIRRDEISPTGLEEMLRDFGIRMDRAIVLELDGAAIPSGASPAGPFFVSSWGDHEITRIYREVRPPFAVMLARPVRPIDPQRATTLMETSERSFAETDVAAWVEAGEPTRDESDLRGPISIAVATRVEPMLPAGAERDEEPREEGEPGGRVVVIGDADFLEPELLMSEQVVNYPVATGIIGWLTQRRALIEIPGRTLSERPVRMSEDDLIAIAVQLGLLFPAAFFFLGLAVWWNRRT